MHEEFDTVETDEIVDVPQEGVSESALETGPELDYGRPITRPPVLDVEEKP